MKIVNVIAFDKMLYIKSCSYLISECVIGICGIVFEKNIHSFKSTVRAHDEKWKISEQQPLSRKLCTRHGCCTVLIKCENGQLFLCHRVSQKFLSKHLQREGLYSIRTISPEIRLSKQEIYLKVQFCYWVL